MSNFATRGYTVLKQIGKGKWGRVFLVEYRGKRYALKIAQTSGAFSSIALPGRLHEAEIMRRSQRACHERDIIRLYDAWVEEEDTYLLMDFVEGQTLSRLVFESWKAPATPEQFRGIMRAVLSELVRLHSLPDPVFHMDATPENILVGSASGRCHLLDYGVAQCRGIAEWTVLRPGSGLVGKPGFVPPERMIGDHSGVLGPSTDLYSAGVIGCMLMLGRYPFTFVSQPYSVADFIIRPMSAVGPLAPYAPVINRAVAFNRSDRFSTARAFLEALEDAG